MNTYRHKLSFCAVHESADLGALPESLGTAAQTIWRAGEPCTTRSGRNLGGVRKNSYCSIDFGSGENLPRSLQEALAKLAPHRALLDGLSASGAKFRFFVGWFSDGSCSRDVLDWELLRDIADLKIALDLDLYGSGDEEPPEP